MAAMQLTVFEETFSSASRGTLTSQSPTAEPNVTTQPLTTYVFLSVRRCTIWFLCRAVLTRRPASADRTARAVNFRRDLEAT